MPHDLTDEQLDELAALVTLFDMELSEELEAILVTWADENRSQRDEEPMSQPKGTVTTKELNDLARRLNEARGDASFNQQ